MNIPFQSQASKVAHSAVGAARDVHDKVVGFVQSVRTANQNFKGRTDNTNYYKGVDYWKSNKN